jgi:hypothetical protein
MDKQAEGGRKGVGEGERETETEREVGEGGR